MANLKNITDLPIAESAEGINLIVNDNGRAKQIAASAIGGGGVKSWNDLEDKPFGVKTEMVEIVPEQSFTKNGTYGEANRFYITGDYDFSTLPVNINGGQPDAYEGEYTIVFNDVTYKCNYSYPPVIFPDDFKAMGLTTIHDCPFELIFFSDGFDLVWTPALGDTITFGAYIEQEVVKQIDPKFLGGGVVPLFVTVNGDKISHTYEQLSEAISKGIPIFISAVWSLDNDYPEGVPVYWNSYTLYKNEGIIIFRDYNGGTEMCRMLSDNSIQWNRA